MRVLAAFLALAAVVAVACGGNAAGDGPAVVVRTPTLPSLQSPTGGSAVNPGSATSTPGGDATPGSTSSATEVPTPANDDATVVACGDILAPLDKQHRLPADCAPASLVPLPEGYTYGEAQYLIPVAADALVRLIDAAARDGVVIYATSSYRSYDAQVTIFSWHVNTYGLDHASRVSARPGHSEHQLGTTADVVSASAGYVLENFAGTPEAAWVAANAARFGFVVSYPDGKEATTGYAYEPWHIRYVGESLAADVAARGVTLVEYLRAR